MKAHTDWLTQFFCDGAIGALVLAGLIYFLLRAFRRDRDDGPPRQGRW